MPENQAMQDNQIPTDLKSETNATHYVSDQIAEGPQDYPSLREQINDRVSVFYGPHECGNCTELIIRQELDKGGVKYQFIYGKGWQIHTCQPKALPFKADTLLNVFAEGKGEMIAQTFPSGIPWDAFQRIADYCNTTSGAATRETRGTPHDAELMKWKRALHSLTPGGSEFANDPDACVNFVKNVRTSQHNYILKLKKENDELRRVSQPVAPPPPPNEIEHLRRMVRLLCDDGVNLEYCRDLAKRTFQSPAAEPVAPPPRNFQLEATLETERQDCIKALKALSGAGICTPAETYGTNTSWAISDLCRAVKELSERAAPAGTQPAQE
jgi:hypothetical protein